MISDSIFSKALVGVLLLVLVGCGSGDNTPPDIDGDGVEDSLDAFPSDPNGPLTRSYSCHLLTDFR